MTTSVSRNTYYQALIYQVKKIYTVYSGHPVLTLQLSFQEIHLNRADAWAWVTAIRPAAPSVIKMINSDES